jgi:creatinine amidohydrolase
MKFQKHGMESQLHSLRMETAYWPEIETAFQRALPVIIPLGANCKEHGLHLPMNTDFIIANYLADWVSENYAVILAPTIHTSFFPAFNAYPGSATVSAETAANYLIELCSGWHRQGARRFYILNTGISTNVPLSRAKKVLTLENIPFAYFDFATLHSNPAIQKIAEQTVGTHADEIETSIMLAINPAIVKMSLAIPEENPNKPGAFTRDPASSDQTISLSGAWGNPTLATREKGEATLKTLKNLIKTDLDHFISEPKP